MSEITRFKRTDRFLAFERLEDRSLLAALDFGDAPAPYPVKLQEDGARHEIVSRWDALGSDLSGEVSALSGDGQTLAVGTPQGVSQSLARIYRWDGAAWQQLGADILGRGRLDRFGKAISLSEDGNTVAIGAPTTGEGGPTEFHSYTRVYRWSGSAWTRLGDDLKGENQFDQFGRSVSLSNDGNVVAVGAPYNNGNGRDAGHTRVYQWDGESWLQLGNDIDSREFYDHFGWSVSLSDDGETVAIGAPISPGFSQRNGQLPGYAEVYRWTDSAWRLVGDQLVGENGRDDFGWSVSLNGDGTAVAVGAPNHDEERGHVRIYRWEDSQWSQHGSDIDGENRRAGGFSDGDQSGWSVSLSDDGKAVAIGAPNTDVPDSSGTGRLAQDAGRTRIYRSNGDEWQQLGSDVDGRFELARHAWHDHSGRNVFLSGDGKTLTVSGLFGTTTDTHNAGRTRVFRLEQGAWSQVGSDIDPGDDHTGWSVSMSADGNVLAFGAPQNDGQGDDSGQVRVFRKISGTWSSVLDLDGADAEDKSGWSVALSGDGNTLAIGAPGNDAGGKDSGQTRIYRRKESGPFVFQETWEPLGDFIAGEREGDQSGWSVSLSFDGDTVAVGAPNNDDAETDSGHTRVYRWNGANWIQLGTDIDGDALGDHSGWAVSLNGDGDLIAIGAPKGDHDGDDTGRGRIYEWNGADWQQQGSDFVGTDAHDQAGWSVALSHDGSTMALGVPNDDTAGSDAGQARVFRRQAGGWSQLGDGLNGEQQLDQFGWATALSADGNIVAIGAPGHDDPGADAGRGQSYRWNGTAWQVLDEEAGLEAGDRAGWSVTLSSNGDQMAVGAPFNDFGGVNDVGVVLPFSFLPAVPERTNFGQAVSLSDDGKTIAIGAPYHNGNGADSGEARVYRWDGTKWQQLGESILGDNLTNVLFVGPDYAGWSVSLSGDGNTLAVGAPLNDANGFNSGHVRLYRWDGVTWEQLGSDLEGENWHDYFGFAIALSRDGDTIAVGAPSNDGDGGVGDDNGQTQIYRYDGETWQQLGGELHGSARGDNFGWSVSLSDDGNTLAVGAPNSDDSGEDAGQAQIYRWNGSSWHALGAAIEGEQGGVTGDNLGWSVSLSGDGDTIAVGAPRLGFDQDRTGYTQIYRWSGSSWMQLGNNLTGEMGRSSLNPIEFTEADRSGWAVSLSTDGNVVAIGAPYNDSLGPDSGETRLFHWDGVSWRQIAHLDARHGNASGGAVSLNSDGTAVAIGSARFHLPIESQNIFDPPTVGSVEVFRLPPMLGRALDSEDDGQPSDNADSDGADDDGVRFGPLRSGETAELDVTVRASGLLDAWIDFNADGDWNDEGEQVFAATPIDGGVNRLSVAVPADAGGASFARFRLSTAGGLTPSGPADDGEVEDYLVTINAAPTLNALSNLSINEDASQLTVDLSGITAGGEAQPLRVTATSDNTSLIPNPSVTYSSAEPSGSISFAPLVDQHGNASITVTVEDGGFDNDLGTSDDNATSSSTFLVVVDPVNDVPTLDDDGKITVNEGEPKTISLTGISAGGGEEQPLRVSATTNDNDLIASLEVTYASPNSTGSLSVRPAANLIGKANINVIVEDGGLDNDLATMEDNAKVSKSLEVEIVDPFPYQNGRNKLDVNDDAHIAPIDVLLVINFINLNGPTDLSQSQETTPPYLDVSGDNFVSPIDALLVINHLNISPDERSEAEGEAKTAGAPLANAFLSLATDAEIPYATRQSAARTDLAMFTFVRFEVPKRPNDLRPAQKRDLPFERWHREDELFDEFWELALKECHVSPTETLPCGPWSP